MQMTQPAERGRIVALDAARGAALVAMAIYHFAWDLEFFGYAQPGMTAVGGWKLFARAIASTFLFLAGISLVLAHGRGIRWNGFWRRFAMVAAAALAISAATYVAVPGGFIFFGILHQIAFASVAGLIFLRWPSVAVLAAAIAVIAAPHFLRSGLFDHPMLWWLGLSSANPRSNDYVPVFPWFGAVLIGIAAGQWAIASGLVERMRGWTTKGWMRPLAFAGRHSLAVYLIHQPVLIGLVYLATLGVPPQQATPQAEFSSACQMQCAPQRDEAFCRTYCVCMLDALESGGRLDEVFATPAGGGPPEWLDEMAWQCTIETDGLDQPAAEEPSR